MKSETFLRCAKIVNDFLTETKHVLLRDFVENLDIRKIIFI